MAIPVSLPISQHLVSAVSEQNYLIVDEQGIPLSTFRAEIVDGQLLIFIDSVSATVPVLIINNYQQASFTTINNTTVTGSGRDLFVESSEIKVATEVKQKDYSLFWWIGSALLAGAPLLISKRTASKPLPAEPFPPELSITPVAQNNILNLKESKSIVTLTGQTRNMPADAVLKIRLDEKMLDTPVVVLGNQFTTEITGEQLASGSRLAVVMLSNNGQVLAENGHAYRVKLTTSPDLQAEIVQVTEDNILNAQEAENNVNVRINLSGLDTDADARVVLFDGTTELGSVNGIKNNGIVEISVAGSQLTSGQLRVEAQAVDSEQNSTTYKATPFNYTIDKEVALPTLSEIVLNGNDNVNLTDINKPSLPLTFNVNGLAPDSEATVRVYHQDQLLQTLHIEQNSSVDTHINPQGITQGELQFEIVATDKSGNQINNSHNRQREPFSLDLSIDNPSVTLKVAGDGKINKAKSQTQQTIDVTVEKLKTGSTTEIILKDGSNILGTQSTSENKTLEFQVDGKLLTSGTVVADINTTNASGNLSSQTVAQSYQIDVTLNKPNISITSIAEDNVITKAEQQSQAVEIKLNLTKLDPDATATIRLFDGTTPLATKSVNQNGEVRFSVPGSALTAKTIKATLSAEDSFGNRVNNIETRKAYTIKTSVQQPTILIESVAGDNIINIEKSKTAQTVAVKLANLEADATASIELLQNGKLVGSATTNQDGKVNVAISDPSQLTANTLTAKVTATDKYEQTTTATSAEFTFTLDVTLNKPTVELVSVSENNIINQNETSQPQPLKFKVSGLDTDATATVTFFADGKNVGSTIVSQNSDNLNFDLAVGTLTASGQLSAQISVTDNNGNRIENINGKNQLNYTLDTGVALPQIAITSIATDNIITAKETSQAVDIKLNLTKLDPDAKATIELFDGTTSLGTQSVNKNGEVRFSVPGSALTAKTIKATLSAEDSFGNRVDNIETSKAYAIKTTVQQPTILIESVADNDIINIEKSKTAQTVAVKLANLEANATALIELLQNDKVVGSATTNQNGTLNVTISNPSQLTTNTLTAKVTATDKYGQTTTATSNSFEFTLDVSLNAPRVTLLSVANDNVINSTELTKPKVLKFKVEELDENTTATIAFLDKGVEIAKTTVQANNNEISFPIAANQLQTSGELSAKISVADNNGNRVENIQGANTLNYTVDISAGTPSVSIDSIAEDNVIVAREASNNVPIRVSVSNLPADLKTATVALYQGESQIGTVKTISRATTSVIFSISASQLAALPTKSLTAKVALEDNHGNRASVTSEEKSYLVDTQTDTPTLTIQRIAGESVYNGTVRQMLSSRQVTGEKVPVVVKVSGLETANSGIGKEASSATVTLRVNNQTYSKNNITQNGDVTIEINKTDLINANSLSAVVTAQDGYRNPIATSTTVTTNYNTDFAISKPIIGDITIGSSTEKYRLSADQLNQTLPVKVKVTNIDPDARGTLTLAINDTKLTAQVNPNKTEYEIGVKGTDLVKNNHFSVQATVKDSYGNEASSDKKIEEYNVDNFLIIKEIDADFNITFTDSREEGLRIEGEVYVFPTDPVDNLGDIWRLYDSVVIKFENGAEYTVPSYHIDPDNDVFTSDAVERTVNGKTQTVDVLNYAFDFSSTEWDKLKGQKFMIIPKMMENTKGEKAHIFDYSKHINGIYPTSAKIIEQYQLKENNSIETLSVPDENKYTHLLKPREQSTTIKGLAIGDDIAVGQEVRISVAGKTFIAYVEADRTFTTKVPTALLLHADLTKVTASTTVLGQELSSSSNYVSAEKVIKELNQSTENNTAGDTTTTLPQAEVNTVGDVLWTDRPYFIQSLFNRDTHNAGFIQNKKAGEALHVKYSFGVIDDPKFIKAMEVHNATTNMKYWYREGQNFSDEQKQLVRNALSKISERTKITFEEVGHYLPKGEGLNFIKQKMNMFGFAPPGGNVHLSESMFRETPTQVSSTILHETLHSLGLKHPFDSSRYPQNRQVGSSAKEETIMAFDCPCGCGSQFSYAVKSSSAKVDEATALSAPSALESPSASTNGSNTDIRRHPDIPDLLSLTEDRTLLTIMSYTRDIKEYGTDLRMLDLAALHYLYGVNPEQRKGNDYYSFQTFNEESTDGDIYIWDGAGVDTFNARAAKDKVTLNLTPGSWNYVGNKSVNFALTKLNELNLQDYFNDRTFGYVPDPQTGELVYQEPENVNYLTWFFNTFYPGTHTPHGQSFIGYGTVIENAIGSDFDDHITGNDGNNMLEGGLGNDTIFGGKGNDALNGGKGADIMQGGEGNDIYFVDNVGDSITEVSSTTPENEIYSTVNYILPDHVAKLTLLGSEDLSASSSQHNYIPGEWNGIRKTLIGNSGNNRLEASAWRITTLTGGEGKDTFVIRSNIKKPTSEQGATTIEEALKIPTHGIHINNKDIITDMEPDDRIELSYDFKDENKKANLSFVAKENNSWALVYRTAETDITDSSHPDSGKFANYAGFGLVSGHEQAFYSQSGVPILKFGILQPGITKLDDGSFTIRVNGNSHITFNFTDKATNKIKQVTAVRSDNMVWKIENPTEGITINQNEGKISIAGNIVKENTNVTASGHYEYTVLIGYSKDPGFIPTVEQHII